MFGRRVFASTPIPRQMWHKLHINNSAQAMRMLPSFAPLASLAGTSAAFQSALAFNTLSRTTAAIGGEEGLVSEDGNLLGAEVAACMEWAAQVLKRSCMPFHCVFSCSPCSVAGILATKMWCSG